MWPSFVSALPLGVEEAGRASVVQALCVGSLLSLGLLTYEMEAMVLELHDWQCYPCTVSGLRNQAGDRHLLGFAKENNNKDGPCSGA